VVKALDKNPKVRFVEACVTYRYAWTNQLSLRPERHNQCFGQNQDAIWVSHFFPFSPYFSEGLARL
jgi:hypothetical protein